MAKKRKSAKRRSQPELKKALQVPQQRDWSMLLLVVVSVVAVVAIVLSAQPATPTGAVYNYPHNTCNAYCPEGMVGVPTGAHGRMHVCRCYQALDERY